MRVPPRNEFENQPPVVENNRPADNSFLLRKSCVKSDQRKNSVSISPITIGSSDYDTGRRSSKDSEIEVLVESPGGMGGQIFMLLYFSTLHWVREGRMVATAPVWTALILTH